MPTSKCSGVLHLLVGYGSASPPGEHSTWSFRTASSQHCNTAAGTVRCKAPSSSATRKMRCSTGEPWGGESLQPLVLDQQGWWGRQGSCAARAVYDEADFTAALLRGARCQPGREFPSSLERDDRQQLHGLAGPRASGASGPPAASRGLMPLSVRVRTAMGPRPPESTVGSARSAQQEEFLGRVVLWLRTDLS